MFLLAAVSISIKLVLLLYGRTSQLLAALGLLLRIGRTKLSPVTLQLLAREMLPHLVSTSCPEALFIAIYLSLRTEAHLQLGEANAVVVLVVRNRAVIIVAVSVVRESIDTDAHLSFVDRPVACAT